MSRLVLVRHCEPAAFARDAGLTDAGRAHARELAARLNGDVVWTSPLRRARETAAELTASARVDDDLREIDFGEFEGRTFDEIATSEPELYRAWMETPTAVRFPGGESWADLKARAMPALERIGDAIVVTHGGVIRAALSETLGIPDEAIFRVDIGYGSVTVIEDGIVRIVNG